MLEQLGQGFTNLWSWSSPAETQCGIPINTWLEGFLFLFTARVLCSLFKLFILNYYFKYRSLFDLFRLSLLEGFLVGWLFYGNLLFYSEDNDCATKADTQFLSSVMHTILILGYITMSFYLFLVVYIPFSFINDEQPLRQESRECSPVLDMFSSLSRIQFNKNVLEDDLERCPICLEEIGLLDFVNELPCSS